MSELVWTKLVIEKFEKALRSSGNESYAVLADMLNESVVEANSAISLISIKLPPPPDKTCFDSANNIESPTIDLQAAIEQWQKISYNGIIITSDFIRNKLLCSGVPVDVAMAAGNLLYAAVVHIKKDLEKTDVPHIATMDSLKGRICSAIDISKYSTDDQIMLSLLELINALEDNKKDMVMLRKDNIALEQKTVDLTNERDYYRNKCLAFEAEKKSNLLKGINGVVSFISNKYTK